MLSPGDKVLVAVSGGMDSVALLHLLHNFREELQVDLTIAHLNHMARGRESDEDAEFIAELGKKLGLHTVIKAVDVKAERGDLKTSFQEAARILRYRFLSEALRQVGGHKVVLGHTADDQVETVLMNLIRGSGLKGLGGIPSQRGIFFRPILDCCRAEVEEWVRFHGFEYRTDSSNSQTDYLRNRIRLDLIPRIEEYNPHFKSGILETSEIIRFDDECLDEQASRLFETMGHAVPGGFGFSRADISALPQGLQKRLLRRAVYAVKGDLRSLSAVHIRDILGLLVSHGSQKRISLPGGLIALVSNGVLEIKKISDTLDSILSLADEVTETELNIPGWTNMESVGLRFQAQLLPRSGQEGISPFPHKACLDFDKTGDRIFARFFRPGDRFVPLGMHGTQKVKSFFIDRKIPREQRQTTPILTTGEGDIIWVYGQRISERYRVTEKTRNLIFLEGFKPGKSPV